MEHLRADGKPDRSWKVLTLIFAIVMTFVFGFFLGALFLVGGFFNRNSTVSIIVAVLIGILSQSGLFLLIFKENRTVFWKALSGILLLPFVLFTGFHFFQAICAHGHTEGYVMGFLFAPYLISLKKWFRLRPRKE